MEVYELADQLARHEAKSEERYEKLCDVVKSTKEPEMGMEAVSDKVNINLGGGDGGGGGSNAAMIAALLNGRNQDSNLGPLMAAMGGGGGGFGGGQGIWAILLLALLGGRGRGGLFGGDDGDGGHGHGDGDGCSRTALTQTILEAVGDIRAQVPQNALETQNVVQNAIAQLALAGQQGFANTKDAVQNLALFQQNQLNNVNQNVSDQGCRTRDTVQLGNTTILQAIAENKYEALKNELLELRHGRHADATKFEVNQTVTQAQAQQQQQWQQQRFDDERFSRLFGFVANIGNQVQRSRNENETINFGNMAASGIQTPTTTNVR